MKSAKMEENHVLQLPTGSKWHDTNIANFILTFMGLQDDSHVENSHCSSVRLINECEESVSVLGKKQSTLKITSLESLQICSIWVSCFNFSICMKWSLQAPKFWHGVNKSNEKTWAVWARKESFWWKEDWY